MATPLLTVRDAARRVNRTEERLVTAKETLLQRLAHLGWVVGPDQA